MWNRETVMAQPSVHTLKIGVVPLGPVPVMATKVIAAHVCAFLRMQSDVLPQMPAPRYALDLGRMQIDAGQVLKKLEQEAFEGYQKIIGVTTVDLYVPIFTYVMGEARQGGRCALVSLYRLDAQNPAGQDLPPQSPAQVLERCAKLALHELGHLFNLAHCGDPLCLMHISGDACELDQRRLTLCRYCNQFLRQNLPHHPLRRAAVTQIFKSANPGNPKAK
jgi:archaemetzincin